MSAVSTLIYLTGNCFKFKVAKQGISSYCGERLSCPRAPHKIAGGAYGTPSERLFIPDGDDVTRSEFSPQEQYTDWSNGEVWQQFKRDYASQSLPAQA